jgi:hypothetical protein
MHVHGYCFLSSLNDAIYSFLSRYLIVTRLLLLPSDLSVTLI